jgi:hypothetical protein
VAQAGLTRPRSWLPGALTEPLSRVASSALGLAVGAVTAVFYFMSSGRSLDYDSSLTVGAFVKTSTLLDPLRRQIQLNNHPLFSVMEHIVWSVGFHTETALRVLPITFGVLTVALLTAWCARLWGPLAGVSAGAVVATNPMFADLARAVRGYSLLSLCALASTLLLWRLLDAGPKHRALEILYVGFVAAGIATHLYGVTVLVAHLGIVIARRQFGATWVGRWLWAVLLGSLIYLKTINIVLNTQNSRMFHGEYARELTLAVLGQARVAAAALGIVVLGALWLVRRRAEILAGVAAILVFVALVWVALQPQFLVVRYWVWLVPGVGLAAAFVVSRRPAAIVLVLIALAGMVVHEHPIWTITEVPTSETAAELDAARAQGMHVCGVFHTGVAVLAYTEQPSVKAATLAAMAKCDFLVGFYVTPVVDLFETHAYPYSWRIPGEFPAYIYSRKPEATLLAGINPRESLDAHAHTYPS